MSVRFLSAIDWAVSFGWAVAGLAVSTMAVLVTIDVIARYLFNAPSKWIHETVSYLLLVTVCMGLAYTLKEKAHIRIDFLVSRQRKAVQDWLQLIASVVFFGYAVLLLYVTAKDALMSFKIGAISGTLIEMPLAPWQAFAPIGFAILALLLIRVIYTEAVNIRRQKPGKAFELLPGVKKE